VSNRASLHSPRPSHRLTVRLPDSMTTWEIHGVSLSKSKGEAVLSRRLLIPPCSDPPSALCMDLGKIFPGLPAGKSRGRSFQNPSSPRPEVHLCHCPISLSTGLCVAKPTRVRVFRKFHLHLRLPISVRRFEQLELRPVLYNYLNDDKNVRP
jgi:hypothetical protein